MSRAVLLPTPGDPFLLQYWLNLYKHYWKNAIDGLYVYVNSSIPDDVVEFNGELLDAAGAKRVLWANTMIDHGRALEELLIHVDEDHLMIIEDDGFIFRSGKVDAAFQRLERSKYRIVASKRGSCSPNIMEMASEKWDLRYDGLGDQGCNFWPNFLFIDTALLKSIGGHFGASAWQAGEMIEGLEMRTGPFANGDTFVSASLRLRAALDKLDHVAPDESLKSDSYIWYEPQYHGNTDDMPDHDKGEGIWSPDCYWTHAGSLSTGITNLLDIERPLPKNLANTEQEKLELERRIMYWEIFWENADPKGIEKFHDNYGEAIMRIILAYGLNEGRIAQRKRAYYEILPRYTDRVFNGS
jgi:hypothetical protein